MICPSCSHVNDGGNFCENCGTKLSITSEIAAATERAGDAQSSTASISAASSVHLDNAKKISKMYWGYFTTVLRKPFSQSRRVGKEQFVNGLITIVLYTLFIPLMIFFGLKDYTGYIGSPFLNIVVKPFFAYFVFIMLIATFTFLAVKFGKVQVSYQDVIARFGTFLIPFVGLFALALVMALLQMKLFLLLLFLGFIASIFTVPAFVIGSFKDGIHEGLDAVYGTVLTYVATFIVLGMMAKALFAVVMHMIQEYISSFFFF
ncbi:zinc ribbon domain-containing protein [Geobacillus proteiniphilus]|uniref:Zinc ribbon domain-containing protein n=2 Tax=Bacillales TaxID=1385 RepID=A0ABY9MEM6_9BACL|nr:zinc ribbon domain-containing protein [Geobacillus proteiniphilus]WMJ16486.1 zinc ribbon domain-containing protein [Geobacillus proteiniphilus]GLH64227.1 hypothetical protein PG301_20660 [Parageobacillus sp. G301]